MKSRSLLHSFSSFAELVILTVLFAPVHHIGSMVSGSSVLSQMVRIPWMQPSQSVNAGVARFERITTADGLSHPVVRDILQDRQGFMWFATDAGIDKYDGYQFTSYKPDPDDPTSLRYDIVRAIFEDRDGNIWVGHGGGLDRMDRTTGTFTHVYTHGQVFHIYEDSTGTLWFGTWRGLFGLDRTTETIEHTYQHDPSMPDDPHGISHNFVNVVLEDRDGDLWIGTNGGLDRMDRTTGTVTHYKHDPDDPASLSHNVIDSIFEDSEGALWIGTDAGGLNQFNRSSETFIHYRYNPEDPNSLGHDSVVSIMEDSNGMLWVGTFYGLDQLERNQNSFKHFQHDPYDSYSLSDNIVMSLYEDRSGVLWVGTANGISKYNRRASLFTPVQSLHSSKIMTMYEDRQGILWVGTLDNLSSLDRQSGRLTVYQHDPADPATLSSGGVYAIYEDHTGTLWIGTGSGGLDQFDPVTETFFHYRDFGYYISSIIEDRSGNLWIGIGFNDGLYRLDRDRETQFHYIPHPGEESSLSHGNITALHVDHTGALWVGTLGGINILDDIQDRAVALFLHYQHASGDSNSLNHNRVLSFYEDPILGEGVMWVGTARGLDRLDLATQNFTHYTVEDGLLDNTVSCILADSAGLLWLGTPKGLSRFDPRTEVFHNYDARDGVLGWFGSACLCNPTGEMIFGGIGAMTFYPEQIESNLNVPPVVITAIGKPDRMIRAEVLTGSNVTLSYENNAVAFEFAVLDFTIPAKNQYAYMMDGLDDDWVYAGTRRYAEYRNMPPGSYTFRVKGSNNDGVWNEEGVAIGVTVKAPFWRTWLFLGFVAILLTGTGYAGYRLRVRSIEIRSRELEMQVEQRTAQLRKESEQRLQVEEALRQREKERAVAEERSRLARELHDAVTQTLFSASIIAEVLPRLWQRDPEEGKTRLEELRELTRGALAEMRMLLLELRPAGLTEAELEDLLHELAESVTGRARLPVTIEVKGKCLIQADVKVALYRIVQEALNNVVKHAGSCQIDVSLHCKTGEVKLDIIDNGSGFDPADIPTESLGLGIMRERAHSIGASLKVTSKIEQGTQIAVVWRESSGGEQ